MTRVLRIAGGRLADDGLLGEDRLRRLLDVLDGEGEAARVVGGAVRNTLLGRPVADVDVTTTALPAEVMRRAKAAGFRTVPTGIEHGTVTVLVKGAPFEVTTLRDDVETDGRHAVVRFSRDFAADAARRDFSMNALSVDRDGLIHDTVGGVADLAAGRVRFIGDADTRIREDFLRILRFFRFHAAYGEGALDPEGLAASERHRDALARLSRERVRSEVLKLLAAEGVLPVIAAMAAREILAQVLPGRTDEDRLARLVALEARLGAAPDALMRLAGLGADRAADVGALREQLRLSNEERDRLLAALAARDQVRADGDLARDAQELRTLLFGVGSRAARDGLLLAGAADTPSQDQHWIEAIRTLAGLGVPSLPLGGRDVLARGVSDGRRVGAVLKRLQAAWIRAGFPQDPAVLARLLDEAIAAGD